jgi:hypothetical protein
MKYETKLWVEHLCYILGCIVTLGTLYVIKIAIRKAICEARRING